MELTRAQRFSRAIQRYQLASEVVKLEVFKCLIGLQRRVDRRERKGLTCLAQPMVACYYDLYKNSTLTPEDFVFLGEHFGKLCVVQFVVRKGKDKGKVKDYLVSIAKESNLTQSYERIMAREQYIYENEKRHSRITKYRWKQRKAQKDYEEHQRRMAERANEGSAGPDGSATADSGNGDETK